MSRLSFDTRDRLSIDADAQSEESGKKIAHAVRAFEFMAGEISQH